MDLQINYFKSIARPNLDRNKFVTLTIKGTVPLIGEELFCLELDRKLIIKAQRRSEEGEFIYQVSLKGASLHEMDRARHFFLNDVDYNLSKNITVVQPKKLQMESDRVSVKTPFMKIPMWANFTPFEENGHLISLQFSKPFFSFIGQRIFINDEYYTVVAPHSIEVNKRKALERSFFSITSWDLEGIFKLYMSAHDFVYLPKVLKKVEGFEVIEGVAYDSYFASTLEKRLVKSAKTGVRLLDFAKDYYISPKSLKAFIKARRIPIIIADGDLLPQDEDLSKFISPLDRVLLTEFNENIHYINLKNVLSERTITQYGTLIRMRLVNNLNRHIVMSKPFFNQLAQKLCSAETKNKIYSLEEIKEISGLKREVLIPFLEVLEEHYHCFYRVEENFRKVSNIYVAKV